MAGVDARIQAKEGELLQLKRKLFSAA